MGKMRAIMRSESAPSVYKLDRSTSVRLQRCRERVQAIVMASRTVRDVPRCLGVVQFCRISSSVVDGRLSLVHV